MTDFNGLRRSEQFPHQMVLARIRVFGVDHVVKLCWCWSLEVTPARYRCVELDRRSQGRTSRVRGASWGLGDDSLEEVMRALWLRVGERRNGLKGRCQRFVTTKAESFLD